jgi:hypothetical protein
MFDQMYNRRFQPRTTDHNFLFRTHWSHRLSSRTSYDLSFTASRWKTFQTHGRWRDTTGIKRIGQTWYDETPANYANYNTGDQLWMFAMGDGAATRDYSSFRSSELKAVLTRIVRQRHQVTAGFEYNYTELRDRIKGAKSGSAPEIEPGTRPGTQFQWWDADPRRSALFLKDRIDLDGLSLEIGLRRDMFNPNFYDYDVDELYHKLFAPTRYNASFPIRFPELASKKASPRSNLSPLVAISFPVDGRFNFHLNYGRFCQLPDARKLFTTRAPVLSHPVLLANPALDWIRTTAYEFGGVYLSDRGFQVDLTGYYHNTGNLPGIIQSYSSTRVIRIMNYVSMGYGDRHGWELKLTTPKGRYFSGWAAWEYLSSSGGAVGLGVWDEAELGIDRRNQISERSREVSRFNGSKVRFLLNLGTPPKFGPVFFRLHPFDGWNLSLFHLWEQRPPVSSSLYSDSDAGSYFIECLPHQETRLMVEKRFGRISELTFYLLVENPFNRKELFAPGRDQDREAYRHSLQPGDPWGTWNKDYIDLGFMDWYNFQHRRQVTFGLRLNLN